MLRAIKKLLLSQHENQNSLVYLLKWTSLVGLTDLYFELQTLSVNKMSIKLLACYFYTPIFK